MSKPFTTVSARLYKLYAQQCANHSHYVKHCSALCTYNNVQTILHIWSTAAHAVCTAMCKPFKTFHTVPTAMRKPLSISEALLYMLYAQQCVNQSPHLKHCSAHSTHKPFTTCEALQHTLYAQQCANCSPLQYNVRLCPKLLPKQRKKRGGGGVGLRKGNSKQKENVSTDLLVRFSFGVPCVHGGCDATGQISLVACLAVLQHLTKVVQLTGTLSNTSLTNKN